MMGLFLHALYAPVSRKAQTSGSTSPRPAATAAQRAKAKASLCAEKRLLATLSCAVRVKWPLRAAMRLARSLLGLHSLARNEDKKGVFWFWPFLVLVVAKTLT